jgi:hypothetical protein
MSYAAGPPESVPRSFPIIHSSNEDAGDARAAGFFGEINIMTTCKRALAPIIVGALFCLATLLSAGTARAQCGSVAATNNLQCDIQLCLYSATGAALVCTNIPAGATVTIVFPAAFNPTGAVSLGGNQYPFSATGCTVCFRQRTATVVPCCGEVCFDRANCTMTVGPCTSAICNK